MQFRRPGKPNVGINIAPLVDVIFLLVIFFAVTTTFLETAGLELELPSSSSTTEREADNVTVGLTADGRLMLDGSVVARDDFATALEAALQTRSDKVVLLRADTSARHGEVVRVMDLIREAGAVGLTIDAKPTTE